MENNENNKSMTKQQKP